MMRKVTQAFQPTLKSKAHESNSSDEEDKQISSDEEEDDHPDQEGLNQEDISEKELEEIEARVHRINTNVIKSEYSKKPKNINPIKMLVSKKKRRFKLEGFNLDLTYVTDNVIAMGFPAENLESFYRNSMADVKEFFYTRHFQQYRIYNLCAEPKYQYNSANFDGNVGLYGCFDHQAPPIKLIFEFCEDMKTWLSSDPKKVSAVHCKAGKGRTGVMICCYLVYSGYCKSAIEALKYYAQIRTKNKKGVTIPSQIRYVYYFEQALKLGYNATNIPTVTIAIRKIKVYTIPKFGMTGGCTPYFFIENVFEDQESMLYDSRKTTSVKSYKSEAYIEYTTIPENRLTGDVLVVFYHQRFLQKDKRMFQIWFNTSFLSANGVLTVEGQMVDCVHKDKSGKKFNKDFKIEVQYEILQGNGL